MKVINKMKGLIIIGLVLIAGTSFGQIDEKRMERDIRIASNILRTLADDDEAYFSSSEEVDGNYVEGYGVIFRVNQGFKVHFAPKVKIKSKGKDDLDESKDKDNEAIVEVSPGRLGRARAYSYSFSTENELDWKDIFTTFLADYSQMIGQLGPSDKIVLTSATSNGSAAAFNSWSGVTTSSSDEGGSLLGLTAELKKQDQLDYSSGKISRDELIKRIKIKESDPKGGRSKDLDIFASTMKTVYDEEYTDSYFISWRPSYEKIEGVGVVFSFKVYSSYDEDGTYFLPAIQRRGLSTDERNQKVKELYPVFIKSFKENMVSYGRSINSLSNDEVVIARVTMTRCTGCELPRKIEFTVNTSVLKNFNSGKISLKEAVGKVKMTEKR